jgi:hypothetical protein
VTVSTTRASGAGPVDAPVVPPRVVRQRRMRPGLFGLAILLVALGGLGSAFAVASVRATGSYLAVARDVPVGTVLGAGDLTRVQVAGGQGLSPVKASDLDRVIGKRAAVSLVPGTLLTMKQLTDKPLLGPGQQQVAVGLKPSQVPARKLNPGDKVLLISTPDKNASNGAPSTRFDGVVIDATIPDKTSVVLYVALAVRDVPAVVALAADSRLAVVLVGSA